MGPKFFQTVMGKRFYESDVPRLVKALERIAKALERTDEPHPDEPIDVKLTKKGLEATKGRPEGDKNVPVWVCRNCGSEEVEGTFWVKLNTQEVMDELEDDAHWCPACEDHVAVKIKEEE